jgi:hypothetical protein
MNTGLVFTAILSLLLALTTADQPNKPQAGSTSSIAIPGNNLNHNETFVRDSTLAQRFADRSLGMNGKQPSFLAGLLLSFSQYRTLAGCYGWVCGSNHSETLVRDASLSRQSDAGNTVLSSKYSFGVVSPFVVSWFGAGCGYWVCGSNHNETFVRDAPHARRFDDRSLKVSGTLQSFLARLFISVSPTQSLAGCFGWVCGSNHNETLVSDLDLAK